MYFCTLYDSNYISKGLALYLSIARHTDDFTMYVMAMDRKCMEMLKALKLDHIIVECIEDNMSPELAEAKANRSRAEFCWTCGSYVTYCFLTKYNLPDITYLDSDLMFFSSPQVIADELSRAGASIGLSPHYVPHNASGKYCVQYCYFKNDENGLPALSWWKDECLKWCYSQIEDGKYGDQMYLDYMPVKFEKVHDISHRGTGMAYWNAFAYKFKENSLLFEGREYPYVFFHYSGFNISLKDKVLRVKECYEVSPALRENLVNPYISLIREVYTDYLGLKVESAEYIRDYDIVDRIIHRIALILSRFDSFHRFKAWLLRKKYSKRNSPYSEK